LVELSRIKPMYCYESTLVGNRKRREPRGLKRIRRDGTVKHVDHVVKVLVEGGKDKGFEIIGLELVLER
jgi:hypothetical protein